MLSLPSISIKDVVLAVVFICGSVWGTAKWVHASDQTMEKVRSDAAAAVAEERRLRETKDVELSVEAKALQKSVAELVEAVKSSVEQQRETTKLLLTHDHDQ